MSQGLDNLEGILEGSSRIAQVLEGMGNASLSNELQTLRGSVDPLEELRDKFFMNTVAAIPATKACLADSEKVIDALEKFKDDKGEASLTALKQTIENLSEAVEELLEKAQMRGTTLT